MINFLSGEEQWDISGLFSESRFPWDPEPGTLNESSLRSPWTTWRGISDLNSGLEGISEIWYRLNWSLNYFLTGTKHFPQTLSLPPNSADLWYFKFDLKVAEFEISKVYDSTSYKDINIRKFKYEESYQFICFRSIYRKHRSSLV